MLIHENRLRWMEQLLTERFGHRWELVHEDKSKKLTLQMPGLNQKIVFECLEPAFMQVGPPHGLKCEWWPVEFPWRSVLGERFLPAPSTEPLQLPLAELSEGTLICRYDILGLAFWTINRHEEVGTIASDEHQRFPATASHAVLNGYLDRPIVDEWLEVLGQMIRSVWPDIILRIHEFNTTLSHDVDRPSRYVFQPAKGFLRAIGGDLIRRHDYKALFYGPWVRFFTKESLHRWDPFNTFHWIMEHSEKIGVRSTFNFISDVDHGSHQADYKLEHPAIRKLLKDIHQRNHIVGLHPSYNCFLSPEKIKYEFDRLKRVCLEEGIQQRSWGGRMHYLRWAHPKTLLAWEAAGLDHDSSLGFADKAGFRCGTCYEFRAYDVVSERTLSIREKPLIAMDGTVLAQKYMGAQSREEALDIFLGLKDKCRKVRGQFCLLWHNSELMDGFQKTLYLNVIN